jgi:hypothetical protein
MDGNEQKILQKHLAQFLVKDVFNLVTEDDILRVQRSSNPMKPDIWYHNGRPLQTAQVKLLQEQAKSFAQSELWKILKSELLHIAHKNGFEKATSEADMVTNKALVYLVDVIDSKLKSIAS